jgi:pimeloyl-ACP methyl ester carboxylesterase
MLPFDEAGTGEAVLLLHAGVADRRMWRGQLEPLAQAGYHAIAVDLPGFGDAAIGEGPQAPWNDVLETMRDLGLEQAALVGNSFGAAVALRAAAIAPAAVRALALISSPAPAVDPSAELQAAWSAESAALDRGDIDAAVHAVVDAWTLPAASADLRDQVAAMQRRAFELQAAAPAAEEAPDPLEQRPELLARLPVPTLVAVGEHDMRDFIEGAASLARTIPHAQQAVIAGAGHLAPLEAPQAFRALLLGFLRESR